jgi:hypothetical protein
MGLTAGEAAQGGTGGNVEEGRKVVGDMWGS